MMGSARKLGGERQSNSKITQCGILDAGLLACQAAAGYTQVYALVRVQPGRVTPVTLQTFSLADLDRVYFSETCEPIVAASQRGTIQIQALARD
jgi:hypothetical protein